MLQFLKRHIIKAISSLRRGGGRCHFGVAFQVGGESERAFLLFSSRHRKDTEDHLTEFFDRDIRVLSATGLYLSHALPNVSDYEEPLPEPPYRCALDEKLPRAQGYIWGGM